jgi:hypothetical protein
MESKGVTIQKVMPFFFLLIAASPIMCVGGSAFAQIPPPLRHDIEKADKIFQRTCTECHSMETALSSRAYLDWLTGISQRHGRGLDWISDEDARLIFLHLIVHLEPRFQSTIQAKRIEPKENWKILICLISGLVTIALLIATQVLGHSKTLRRKWFKGHGYFATATLVAALFHGSYCFYFFVLA